MRKMEERFGRGIACRVVIRAPGAHHQRGEPFSVSIQVALPGNREVNVGRISNSHDPRQADLVFAVNDAFRRAMR
ncbi:MAG: HPF/RaiA family ribosome-associated protein, partial [Rhizomicrobium sp.]